MKTIYVGKNREFKTTVDAFAKYYEQEVEIILEEGYYIINEPKIEKDTFENTFSIKHIKSTKKAIITQFSLSSISGWTFSGLIFQGSEISLNFGNSVKFENCIFVKSRNGISFSGVKDITFRNNTVIQNSTGINVLSHYNITDGIIEKNVICYNNYGLRISESNEILPSPNLCFNNGKNIEGILAGIIEESVEFVDFENNDFRIKDEKYKDFGASEELLLLYAGKTIKNIPEHKKAFVNTDLPLSVFLNLNNEELIKKYEIFFSLKQEEWGVQSIKYISDIENIKKGTQLFIVNSTDIHSDITKVFKLIEYCKKNDINYKIITPDQYNFSSSVKSDKVLSILKQKDNLVTQNSEQIIYYIDIHTDSNLNDLSQKLYQLLVVKLPSVKIQKLKLKNIGQFNEVEFDFEEKLNYLIGLNGTGKTTVLRAIAVALTANHQELTIDNLSDLIRIHGIKQEKIIREDAYIELKYTLNENDCNTKVLLLVGDNGNVDKIWNNDYNTLVKGDFLQAFAIGFAQSRGKLKDKKKTRNIIQLPNIKDLLPIILNEDDNRLYSFSKWIIDLSAEANRVELEAKNEGNSILSKERKLIHKVFEVFSDITDDKIIFKEIRQNNEVWIITSNNPEGIPLDFVS